MMTPFIDHRRSRVRHGACRDVLATVADDTFDSVVCDPPYALTAGKKGGSGRASVNLDSPYGRARIGTGNGRGGFMGKSWDAQLLTVEDWAEVLEGFRFRGIDGEHEYVEIARKRIRHWRLVARA